MSNPVTTPNTWLSNFQVHAPTAGDQRSPVVTVLEDGRILYAWLDDDDALASGAGRDVVGQFYDVFGNAIGSPFQLNQNVSVGDQIPVRIEARPDGGFVAIYGNNNLTRLDYEIYDANGSHVQSGNIYTIGSGQLGAFEPDVAVQADGSFMVSYVLRTTFENERVEAVKVSADGLTTSEPFIINNDSDTNSRVSDAINTRIIALSSGNYAVVSDEQTSSSNRDIQLNIFTDTGIPIAQSTIASTSSGSSTTDRQPNIAQLTNGNIVVVWEGQTNIRAQIFTENGATVTGILSFFGSNSSDTENEPAVTALQDGGFFIVYDDDTDRRIEGARFDENGNQVGSVMVIGNDSSTGSTFQPEVAEMTDGRIVVNWNIGSTAYSKILDPRDNATEDVNGDVIGTILDDIFTQTATMQDVNLYDGNDTLVITGLFANLTKFDGGAGTDTLDLRSVTDEVRVITRETGFDYIQIRSEGSITTAQMSDFETFRSGAGNDLLIGHYAKQSIIYGGDGNDVIVNSDDSQKGGAGVNGNFFYGEGGDDTMGMSVFTVLGLRSDVLTENNRYDGGEGSDTISFVSYNLDYVVDLTSNGVNGVWRLLSSASTVLGSLFDIENIIAGNGDDILTGSDFDNLIDAGSGDDTVQGNDGNDTLYGRGGADIVSGGLGNDFVSGGDGDDTVRGNAGDDTLEGGNGSDTLFGNSGNDAIDGGGGFDLVDYSSAASGIVINLDTVIRAGQAIRTGSDGDGFTDTFRFIEEVRGTDFDDVVYGSATRNTFFGEEGDDELYGRGGNDILSDGAGTNILNGASGFDTASYIGAGANMTVNLADGVATSTSGTFISDTLISIEIVEFEFGTNSFTGNGANNRMFGGAGVETAFGGGGNDILFGEGGEDVLVGEEGSDRLYGGADADSLFGGNGVDILDGGAGGDLMDGGADGDRFYGRDGDDTIFGRDGIDILNGQEGNDELRGGNDRDFLRGGDDDDSLYGEGGDDRIDGGTGTDTAFYGGDSTNFIYYRSSSGAIVIEDNRAGGTEGRDILTNVEFLAFNNTTIDVDLIV